MANTRSRVESRTVKNISSLHDLQGGGQEGRGLTDAFLSVCYTKHWLTKNVLHFTRGLLSLGKFHRVAGVGS